MKHLTSGACAQAAATGPLASDDFRHGIPGDIDRSSDQAEIHRSVRA
jgi:hypothetical protein